MSRRKYSTIRFELVDLVKVNEIMTRGGRRERVVDQRCWVRGQTSNIIADVYRDHPFRFSVSQVRCMKLVQHPNVVRLYEVIDTQTKLYLILELGDGGDLYDYIMRHDSGLSEEVYARSFEPIACNDPALPGKSRVNLHALCSCRSSYAVIYVCALHFLLLVLTKVRSISYKLFSRFSKDLIKICSSHKSITHHSLEINR